MYGTSYNKALYDCALECTWRRRNRRCKHAWDSPACSECTFYVKNYINAEPNQAKLFMMQAEMQVATTKGVSQGRAIALVIAAVVIALVIGACNIKSVVDAKRWEEYKQRTQSHSLQIFEIDNKINII